MNRRSFFTAFAALGAGLTGLAHAPVRLTMAQRLRKAADFCQGRTPSLGVDSGTYTYKVAFVDVDGNVVQPPVTLGPSTETKLVRLTAPPVPTASIVRRRLYSRNPGSNAYFLVRDDKV